MFNLDLNLVKAMVFLLMLIAVNVILGIAIAFRQGNFNLSDLPRFLRTEILPYYLSLASLVALAMVQDVQAYGTKPLAWGAIIAYGSRVVFVELRQKVIILFGPEASSQPDKQL